MTEHRKAIMAKRQQAHANHEGSTTRRLMARGFFRRDTSLTQRTDAESKKLGLPHQGIHECARRWARMAYAEAANGRP